MKTCPHCGKPTSRARSLPDHRRLFAVIAAAHAQWPEQHDFQPDCPEHLRAWLICAAGPQFRVSTVCSADDDSASSQQTLVAGITAALLLTQARGFVRAYRGGAAVFAPKTMKFEKMPQHEFADLRSAIEAVIEREVGATAEQLLQGSEAA